MLKYCVRAFRLPVASSVEPYIYLSIPCISNNSIIKATTFSKIKNNIKIGLELRLSELDSKV